jgi:hypothetical protein
MVSGRAIFGKDMPFRFPLNSRRMVPKVIQGQEMLWSEIPSQLQPARIEPPDNRGHPSNVTWLQAANRPEVSARLKGLPGEIVFFDDFPEPIRYDSARGRLYYRGLMTRSSFDYLRTLSRQLDYQAALHELNYKSSEATARRLKKWWQFWK